MKRIEAIKQILEVVENELVISNIGFPSRELYSIDDREKNFYMLGSMGLASSIGLGLSVNIKKMVWVIEGDGSVLMNLGTLSTISNYANENYTLIILDDSSYGSTGCQPTHTSMKTNLADISKAAGLKNVFDIKPNSLKKTLKLIKKLKGPTVLIIKINSGNSEAPIIKLSPIEIKNRFMEEVKC